MDKLKSIWLLLSLDAVLCCNESSRPANAGKDIMPFDLFAKIAKRATEQSWTCTILGNRNGIPKSYQALSNEMKARIILPAEYEGTAPSENTTIVFESNQVGSAAKHPSVSRAILRIQRSHLQDLSEIVLNLLHYFADVSIRHPELLLYTDQDMATYKDQLFEICLWQRRGNAYRRRRFLLLFIR